MKKATRKELIKLLKELSTHRIDHTDRCTWEELNHGGDCACGVSDDRGIGEAGWGFSTRIKAILEAEKQT